MLLTPACWSNIANCQVEPVTAAAHHTTAAGAGAAAAYGAPAFQQAPFQPATVDMAAYNAGG
jgi:hypothetical protein